MNQPTLRPVVVPGRPRSAGFRAACLALLSWCVLPAALVHADPIAPTTIGFTTASGAVGGYYNGGTDGAGNSGPNVGIVANTAGPAIGGVLDGLNNPTFNVPAGFTTGFSVQAINVAIGFAINVYDGENGTGTLLASQGFSLNGNTTGSASFSGTAKSVVLSRWSGNPSYDNLTFGSATIGTPVNEPPAVTTSAATAVTSATATLNATINPAGTATTAQFEYGTTPSYGSTASVTLSPNDGSTAQSVSASLTGLAAGTLYYFRVTAVNSVGSRNGSELTFTTPIRPAVTGLTGGGLFRFNNQGFTVGYEFSVSQTITVDRLGFYDEGNDGLVTAHDVGIFDLCGTLRASGTVAAGTSSPLNGGYRYVSITPVVLAAGTYRIGAVVFNGGSHDRFLHGVTTVATDSTVTFVRGKLNNGVALLQFPTLDATATGLVEKSCFGPNFTFAPGGTPPGEPEANVKGQNVPIVDGDTSPDTADHTDFGSTMVAGGTVVRTFTIENLGTADLTVSGISKSGTHQADFTLGALTPASPIPPGHSATFTVTFDPSDSGPRTATISVASNDCDENPYDFAVEGTGTLPPATALHFDGANDSVDIPHSAGQLSYPFTVEAWVKTTDADGILVSKYVGSSGNGWQMGMGGGKLTAWFFRPGGAGAIFPTGAGIVGATPINNGTWHHVAFVVDSTGGRLFVDGVSDGFSVWTSGTPGPATTTVPVRLGNETTGFLYPFAGALDEVRIWAVARSAAELQAYKSAELAVLSPCLVGYYKLNHGTVGGNNAGVTTAVDATGNSNGTLNNFALTGLTSNWTDGSGITETASAFPSGVPDINLKGGSPLVTIPDGTTATGTANGTDFGSSLVGTGVAQTFTLENTGTLDLTVSALSFSGANPGDYAVSGITLPATVAANDSTTFTVTFTPTAAGARTATLNVVNDDCDESNYDFALTGTGTVNNPPTVAANSSTITVNEGTEAFNGISFSDPDGDTVTLTASLGTVSASGGTSAFAGSDLATAGQWRTSSVVKTKDLDGNNVYGTDGYAIGALDGVETVVNPAYATITRNPALLLFGGTPDYRTIDDPVNPGGPQKVAGIIYDAPSGAVPTDFYTLTFTQARRVRLGILVDNSSVPAVSPTTLRLRQTAGGTYDSGDVAAGDGTSRNQTVDYYFFDIAAQAGDVFVISGINDTAHAANGLGGIVLDSASWSYATLDGPAGPTTVTITATDNGSPALGSTATFTLAVDNVAPTIALTGNATVDHGTPFTLNLGAITDPGTDTVTAFSINWGDGNTENFTGNPASTSKTHTYASAGSKTISVALTDEDGTHANAGTKMVTVENEAPTVAGDAATVTVSEGTTAFNSGTFADANGDTVTVTASVGTITQSGAGTWTHQQTLTQGGTPIELTLDSQENLYVANEGQNTLYKYNAGGSLVTSWLVSGNPTGVAVDSVNGWLYVALKGGHRIDKFTLSGTLLTSWGSLGSGNGQFSGPHCVAVDAAGDVYVADSGNNRIQVFSPAGAFLRKWGSGGSGDGLFNFPQGLRISPGGTLYVADRGNNRVQYFDTAGTFLGKWGTGGNGNGQFSSPAGIGIDPGGNIVVGDIFNNRIQKFTATGTFVDKLGPSTTVGNLALPHGTAFPPSGRSVYIADFSNGRVVKFATPGGWNWSYTPADGAAGPTTVTITATDNGSPHLSSTTTFTLNVNNVAPTIALTGNATVPNGTPYTLNLGAITDPGTDTVSAFSINWGDGNTENFTGNPASTSKTHTYAALGAKTITVTLTDEDGAVIGGTRSVTVENAAPVAAADGLNRPNTTRVAKVLKSELLGNDSDADLDPLTLTAVGSALPAGSTVVISGNFVIYTAPANNSGSGSFAYTLSDGPGGHTVTGTVTVTETSASTGGGTPNALAITPTGDDFTITFLGVPGGSFRVQYTTDTSPPYTWNEFVPPAIHTATPNGVFTHTDVNPPDPVRLYRAVGNP